ncbi:MAG TPA: hypothetical protein VF599_03805 [Pyrinomonadaceae bacterium]|jgi:hypothetical protein
MQRKQIDFLIHEAGCLLYVADKNLGGFPFSRFHEFFGGVKGLEDLVLRGAVLPLALYQDDGYSVRVCLGDLTAEEQSQWTSKVTWKLNLASGKMVVSGVCDEDLDDDLADFPVAEQNGEYWAGCLVEMPAGEYEVSVYSYPPGDLAGGWMRIEQPDLFRACFGAADGLQYEKPLEYFKRTRPEETPPDWIKKGFEEADFLNFLIHLAPLSAELKTPLFEPDGCLLWEYRKPEICPVGIIPEA